MISTFQRQPGQPGQHSSRLNQLESAIKSVVSARSAIKSVESTRSARKSVKSARSATKSVVSENVGQKVS